MRQGACSACKQHCLWQAFVIVDSLGVTVTSSWLPFSVWVDKTLPTTVHDMAWSPSFIFSQQLSGAISPSKSTSRQEQMRSNSYLHFTIIEALLCFSLLVSNRRAQKMHYLLRFVYRCFKYKRWTKCKLRGFLSAIFWVFVSVMWKSAATLMTGWREIDARRQILLSKERVGGDS